MIKIDTSNNTLTVDSSTDLSSSITDTLYCYDSTTMNSNSSALNTINYPGNVTGANNIFITNNTGTISPNWTVNDTITLGSICTTPMKVYGDAEIEGKLKIGGKDIGELIEKLEERLAILHPNAELEDRWEELKELGRRYKELEQDILEKEKIYNILKK